MAKTQKSAQQQGRESEDQAQHYLCQHGLSIIEENFRCKCGEIDLIMRDGDTLVFIEVRYRKSNIFGGALQSIGTNKQRRIRQTAMFYLQQHRLFEKTAARFDVLAMSANDIQWIKGAF